MHEMKPMKPVVFRAIAAPARYFVAPIVLAVSGLAALPALATSPTEFDIVGNTIQFGFQDWYQVQDASDFRTLCEGYDDCTVPNGTYNIINLSTRERFEEIEIGSSIPLEGGSGVITFAGEGWFQVQNATTFESICEGGNECTVPAGTYIVINHTTGERTMETVTVTGNGSGGGLSVGSGSGSGGGSGGASSIAISGNTISLPDDGWYQVQRKSDFSTVCEGLRECTVPPGVFIVINHTTGVREEVIVGTSITPDNALDLLTQAFEVFRHRAYDDRMLDSFSSTDGMVLVAENNAGDGSPVNRSYACANGGEAEFLDTSTNSQWQYSDCMVGAEVRNGLVRTAKTAPSSIVLNNFENYETTIAPSGSMRADGRFVWNQSLTGSPATDSQVIYSSDFDLSTYEFSFSGGTLVLSDVSTFYRRGRPAEDRRPSEPNRHDQAAVGSFVMSPPFSTDTFEVTSDLVGQLPRGERIGEPNLISLSAGSMQIVSQTDGSVVVIDPDTGVLETVAVRITSSSGEAPIETIYTWAELPFFELLSDTSR